MVAPEILADRRAEVARKHLVIDPLHVDVLTLRGAEVLLATGELLLEAQDIEAVAIETGERRVAEEFEDLVRLVCERGTVLHDLVRDSVDRRRLRRNRNRRIQKPALLDFSAVGHYLNRGQLDDAVLPRGNPSGFDVETDERIGQFEKHKI